MPMPPDSPAAHRALPPKLPPDPGLAASNAALGASNGYRDLASLTAGDLQRRTVLSPTRLYDAKSPESRQERLGASLEGEAGGGPFGPTTSSWLADILRDVLDERLMSVERKLDELTQQQRTRLEAPTVPGEPPEDKDLSCSKTNLVAKETVVSVGMEESENPWKEVTQQRNNRAALWRAPSSALVQGTLHKRHAAKVAAQELARGVPRVLSSQSSFRWPSQARLEDGSEDDTQWGWKMGNVASLRRLASSVTSFKAKFQMKSQLIETVWTFLEEPMSSRWALVYSYVRELFICLTVLTPMMQSVESPWLSRRTSDMVENVFDSVFVCEVLLRWSVSPFYSAFVLGSNNLLDALAAASLTYRSFLLAEETPYGDQEVALLYCVVPLMRSLKVFRFSRHLRLLLYCLFESASALQLPLFLLFVMTLAFGALVFIVEPRDEILSMPHAIYFVVVSVTTVGYGDVYPVTPQGQFVCCVLSLMGVFYMAMPMAIIGGKFQEQWNNRDFLVLVERVKERLKQWSFTEAEARGIFEQYDRDGSGELTLKEFFRMLVDMRLGLTEDEVVRVFNCFDTSGDRTLQVDEFMEVLYPPEAELLRMLRQEVSDSKGLGATARDDG